MGEAREDIRSLIGEVVITPGSKRGESHATLRGELIAILDLAAGRRRSPKTEVITNALAPPAQPPIPASRRHCFRSPGYRCDPSMPPACLTTVSALAEVSQDRNQLPCDGKANRKQTHEPGSSKKPANAAAKSRHS